MLFSLPVGVDIIEGGRAVIGQACEKFIPVACPVYAVDGTEFLARFVRHPAQGQSFLRIVTCEIAQQRPMVGEADDFFATLALDENYLFLVRHSAPFIAGAIEVVLEPMDFFAVQLDIVAQRRGHTPSDVSIVAKLDIRQAGDRSAPGLIILGRVSARRCIK